MPHDAISILTRAICHEGVSHDSVAGKGDEGFIYVPLSLTTLCCRVGWLLNIACKSSMAFRPSSGTIFHSAGQEVCACYETQRLVAVFTTWVMGPYPGPYKPNTFS
jgi:hypothetical protein